MVTVGDKVRVNTVVVMLATLSVTGGHHRFQIDQGEFVTEYTCPLVYLLINWHAAHSVYFS